MPLLLLILGLLLASCERPDPRGVGRDATDDADPSTPAAYERRFAFLGGAPAAPTVAFYDFASLYDGARLRRSARGWLREDRRWTSFLDEGWESDSMRAPWRLVPHGPFRLLIGDDDDVEALILRTGESEIRLNAGPSLAAWSPDRGAQLGIRRAELQVGADRFTGVALDAQLARVPAPAHIMTAAAREFGDGPAPDSADAGEAGTSDDAEPGDEAFLTDGGRLYLVVSRPAAATSFAWLRDAGDERSWEGGRVERAGTGGRADRWRLVAPQGDLIGEFDAIGPVLAASDIGPFARLREVILVRGSVQVAGEQRPVFGIIWRGQG